MKKCVLLICAIVIISAACEKKEILPGKREEVFSALNKEADKTIAPLKIIATSASSIDSYVDIGGNKRHNHINYQMPQNPQIIWKTDIGRGPITSDPIYINGNIYAIDSLGILCCVSAKDGKIIWKKEIAKQPDESVFSGGLTFNNGIVFVSTNIGKLIAIDSKTQKEIWNRDIKSPLKGAPLFIDEKIIITSIDNQTFAVDSKTGNILWSKTIDKEQTTMTEFGSPASYGQAVICPYSSGDVFSIDASSGVDNWSDVLLSSNISESGFVISHIAASPIVYENYVLTATSESKMVLIDAVLGTRIWEQELGTLHTPVINNGWIFALSGDNRLVCLALKDGAIKWQSDISSNFKEKSDRESVWTGPLMINSKIVIFNDHGHIASFDISTGKVDSIKKLEKVSFGRTPMVVNKIMYFITDRAELYAVG